jgi:C1A family cysteine protease
MPVRLGFGWEKDELDERDFGWRHIKSFLARGRRGKRPRRVDHLLPYFPPVRDQGQQDSSTAFACLATVEYFQRRALGTLCERSKAFLYAMTREATRAANPRGLGIRNTLKALVRFGTPPEIYWPYTPQNCDQVAADDCWFASSGEFRGLCYARLDPPDASGKVVLKRTRIALGSGIPVVFGYEVHHLMSNSSPFPLGKPFYTPGWQSVVACGYDDRRQCLLIRNSWGSQWGTDGYGWLPYAYVIRDHAADFWVIFKPEWLEAPTHPQGFPGGRGLEG